MDSGRNDSAAESDRQDVVSVLLPCRDEAPVLAETLSSFLAALESIHEIIFIDDGSRDRTSEIAREMLSDCGKAIFVRHETPVGTAASLQEGLALATGRFVFMAAGDDPIDGDLLPIAVRWLNEFPEAGIFSAESRGIDADGNPQPMSRLPRPVNDAGYLDAAHCRKALYREDSWFAGNTCVYRTEVLRNIGIDPELGPFCDGYAAWTAALRHGACFVARPLSTKRNIAEGVGVGMFKDPVLAGTIWKRARARMAEDPLKAYPDELIERMERRWRYNIVRAKLEARFVERFGRIGGLAFAAFRFAAALRYKPFDVASILVRRKVGSFAGIMPRNQRVG